MNRRSFLCMTLGSCAAALAGCSTNVANNEAFLTVEPGLCVGCGECVRVCDGDAIMIINNKAIIDPAKCKKCGKCVKVCPYDAIS
ncbi:MAG: 4Fe-4S binding protein [Chitinispirillaceae bacterium]|nr:4Fe-4S binding protein [Chitinispirillaceae bacterium]